MLSKETIILFLEHMEEIEKMMEGQKVNWKIVLQTLAPSIIEHLKEKEADLPKSDLPKSDLPKSDPIQLVPYVPIYPSPNTNPVPQWPKIYCGQGATVFSTDGDVIPMTSGTVSLPGTATTIPPYEEDKTSRFDRVGHGG